jgi:outer membrane protein OmpA-like peptidoglycan-associated protein
VEAIRSGRSFAELVLSKTLVYRVEQVFLIHRETGLLLQHVVAESVEAQDADMVSGMLTAIQDFVRDSFQLGAGDELQTMEVGDLQVWVEQGPRAVLAAAVRGTAPVELRQTFRAALEAIHHELGPELGAFDGDAAPFVAARPCIEECIRAHAVASSTRASPWLWVAPLLLLAGLTWWVGSAWNAGRKLDRLLGALRREPGFVVTEVVEEGGRPVVVGLRDPLARAPEAVVSELGLDPRSVELRLRSYCSGDGPLVLERARRVLRPPVTISLAFAASGGVLEATGTADQAWSDRARELAPLLPGVAVYDDSDLGAASEAERRFDGLKAQLVATAIRFELASAAVGSDQEEALDGVARTVIDLLEAARGCARQVTVRVEGFADPTGGEEFNLNLSHRRADAVVDSLVRRGVSRSVLSTLARGALVGSELGQEGTAAGAASVPQLEQLRRVSFTVEETPPSGAAERGR